MSSHRSEQQAVIYRRRTRKPRSPLIRPLDVRPSVDGTPQVELQDLVAAFRSESSTGPYAPPSFIRGYNQIEDGLGSEVLRSGIRRVDAFTTIDLNESATKQTIDRRGQWIALGVVVLVLAVATTWLLAGHPVPATILATSLIVSLAIVFVGSSKIDVIAQYFGTKTNNQQSSPPKLEQDS